MSIGEQIKALRLNGMSVRKIESTLKVPRSTVSYHCKGLRQNNQRAVNTGPAVAEMARRNRLKREQAIANAIESWPIMRNDRLYLALLAAYWGEGTKSLRNLNFKLTNSDPGFIKAAILALNHIGIPNDRLYGYVKIYPEHNMMEAHQEWERVLGINCIMKINDRRNKKNRIKSKHGVCDLSVKRSTCFVLQIITHLKCWRDELQCESWQQ